MMYIVEPSVPAVRTVTMKRSNSLDRLAGLAAQAMAAATLLVLPVSVFSHHSFSAEFTAEATAHLTGTVTEVWFRNPHVRYLFTVKAEDGTEEEWDARGSPVVWLARKGWTKDSIKAGDTVTFYGYLGRDGRKMLSIMTVTLQDGTVLTDRVPEDTRSESDDYR